MSGTDDDRWQRETSPVDEPPTARETPIAHSPTAPTSIPPPRTGPFDPPRRARFEEGVELGRGGMGRVYEALDTALERQVAIKQSLADDDVMVARFEREVRITARLQHPGIVPILDAGRDETGRPFYVMRKIEGRPLADAIAEASTPERRLALVPNVLAAVDAVAYAHSRGVIHRDIKSWNVLVGPFGETLVIDWGIARELADDSPDPVTAASTASTLTRAGQAYGTPGFMAPEQARGEVLDRRADVFALGAMLYHTLTGRRPLADLDPAEAVATAARGVAPDLGVLTAPIPRELVAIVGKAMAVKREDRYSDAGALAEDLRRFTTGQLVAAHAYSTRDLVMRWLRRHRVAVTIATIATLTLVVVGVFAIRRVLEERDRADIARDAEAARADDLLVERADAIVDEDPTHAIALLRGLRDDSAAWERAVVTYDSAVARGVARGRVAHTNVRRGWVRASPTGNVVVSVAEDGLVLLHDPAFSQPARRLATLDRPRVASWIDNESIAVLAQDGLHRVGVDGSTKRIADASHPLDGGDGRLFVSSPKLLRELDPRTGATISTFPGVVSAARVGRALVYATADEITYQADGQPVSLVRIRGELVTFGSSYDGKRFAAATSGEVIEWDVSTGVPVERGRWNRLAEGIVGITINYAGSGLIVEETGRSYLLFPSRRPYAVGIPVGMIRATATTPDCTVMSMFEASLWLVCETISLRIGGRAEGLVSIAVASGHLVGATEQGVLLSWDLGPLRPKPFPMTNAPPRAFIGGKVWTQTPLLRVTDVTTGVVTKLGEHHLACAGASFGVIFPQGPDGKPLERIDLQTLERSPLSTTAMALSCDRDDRVVVFDRVQIEIRDLRSRATLWSVAAARPDGAQLNGTWLVTTTANTVERFEIGSGLREKIVMPAFNAAAIDATGRVAVMYSNEVAIWNRDGGVEKTAVPDAIGMASTSAGFGVVTRDRSLIVIGPGGVRRFRGGKDFGPTIARDRPFATLSELDGRIAIIDLRTGWKRRLPIEVNRGIIDESGTRVIGMTNTNGYLWELTTSTRVDVLRAAIARLTNARVASGSTRVEFEQVEHR